MHPCTIRLSGLALAALAVLASKSAAQENPDPGAPAEALDRWRARRFGMFIHWGPVSLTGHEIGWSRGRQTPVAEYDTLYKKFNPVKFNADEWVKTAMDAGMKYMVITTKHHDGFCIWDTKQIDYNIMNSPFGRDVLKELSAACKREGLAFGTYYSVCDWYHPAFPLGSPGGRTKKPNPNLDAYMEYLTKQVTELIKNYGPLSTMWFDVPQEVGPDRGLPVVALVRSLQPDIIINNRAFRGRGTPVGDYDTPEQRVGTFRMERPWETCMTICRQWAWKPDDTMKSLKQCLQTLIKTVGGDGNLLFNVGPMPDGRIEQRQIDRLKEMGAWLKKYGQSIYDTRGGPFKPGRWGASTRQGNRIFLHVFNWEDDTLELPPLPTAIKSSRILTGGTVTCKQNEEGLTLRVAPEHQKEIDTLIELEIEGSALELEPVNVKIGASLTTGAKATASNIFQKNAAYSPDKALDGDGHTRWATDAGTHTAWLEVDLRKPVTFDRMSIDEWSSRVRTFELQIKEGDAWKTIFQGKKIGEGYTCKFKAVTARVVRLNILQATEGPTLCEFHLYGPKKKK
jgi:alpha-L-fucosidase